MSKNKLHPTSIRLPEDLRETIRKVAKIEGRSVNNLIIKVLRKKFGTRP